jgi:two-component system LytT family sensor kinase
MPSIVLWTIVGAAVALAAAAAFKYRADLKNRQNQIAELERLLGEARLDALRTQLHPHFLFNALNAISAHVERDPQTARWMLDRLGSLLRMSLEHAREREMPLERELTFIACYIDLQKVRFDDRIALVTDVAPEVLSALVPSLVLQPLVENAVRHGIASGTSPGRIDIRASRNADLLHLIVTDDGPGLPADWNADEGFGVGLSNTRERLERLYGKQATFEIANLAAANERGSSGEGARSEGSAKSEGNGVRVTLTLPLHFSPPLPQESRERGPGGEGGLPTEAVEARIRTVADTRGS